MIAVYMPHGGLPSSEVEQMYMFLSGVLKQARKDELAAIICGDWNAVVGRRLAAEDPGLIGDGAGQRNARGSWMVQWSMTEKMNIVSTQFDKDFSRQWTYIKGGAPRQIDYASIDVSATALVKDAEASDDLSMGMDHRAEGCTPVTRRRRGNLKSDEKITI